MVAPTVQPDLPETFIRYAASDEDVVAIHGFLLDIARPAMRCRVDHRKSAQEVWRVVNEEVALMGFHNGELVGTLGVVAPTWWYGDGLFMTDRWHFLRPEHQHGPINAMLLDEAVKIARAAGLEFIHQGKIRTLKDRGMNLMMPRVLTGESAT